MTTQWMVKKNGYLLFASSEDIAKQARRNCPELKGGRIMNVLQAKPSAVYLGALYLHGELVRP